MISPINTFTIHNMIGFMVCGSLTVMFFLVYFKGGRRVVDLVAGLFVLWAGGMCLTAFLSDNLIPAGFSAWGWEHGPNAEMLRNASLEINRWAWVCGALLAPSQLHFVLCYCQKRNFLRRYIWVFHLVTVAALPTIWTPLFVAAPAKPIAETSSWTTTLPWMPDPVGPGPMVVVIVALAVQIYGLVAVWKARRLEQQHFAESAAARKIVFFALLVQMIFAIGDGVASSLAMATPALMPIGSGTLGVLLSIALIRSRVEADRVRRQLASEKAALLECIPQPLLYFSKDSKLQWANDQAVAFAGRTHEELLGSGIDDVWNKIEGERPPVELAWEKGEQVDGEFVDTEQSTWMVGASPVKGSDGKPVGAIVLATDITEIRQAQEALRDTNIKIIAAREEECRRVARDLHDSVAQGLTSLQMHLCAGAAKAAADTAEKKQMDFASKRCGELGKEVRQISHQLYPPALDLLGLAAALEEILIPYRTAGVEAAILSSPESRKIRMPQDTEVAIYRVAQEAVNNATRHGKATKIDIELQRVDNDFVLTVTDNGCGFDVGKKGAGLGMNSMKSRMEGVRGKLKFSSGNGKTCVTAWVALPEAMAAAKREPELVGAAS